MFPFTAAKDGLHSPRQAHSGIVLCGTPKLCYTQTPQLLDETRKQKLPDIACTFFVPKILCNTSGLLLDGYQTPINLIVRAFVSPVYGFFSPQPLDVSSARLDARAGDPASPEH